MLFLSDVQYMIRDQQKPTLLSVVPIKPQWIAWSADQLVRTVDSSGFTFSVETSVDNIKPCPIRSHRLQHLHQTTKLDP
ncbi:MAG: hypothetical protein CMN58_02130 [Solibacterales bacterium]|nr:hypothetical protein [Bryobacterales bacterium]